MTGMGETKIINLITSKGSVFDYKLKRPHNDILAFMCVIIFYPFIKNNLTFKFPISERFLQQFKKIPNFKHTKVTSQIINIPPYNGNKNLITVGGGLDSTSIMCLFKDALLYHQQGKEKVDVNLICKKVNMKETPYIVNNNVKDIIKEKQFTHWVTVFVGSLLIAMDNNVKNILLEVLYHHV